MAAISGRVWDQMPRYITCWNSMDLFIAYTVYPLWHGHRIDEGLAQTVARYWPGPGAAICSGEPGHPYTGSWVEVVPDGNIKIVNAILRQGYVRYHERRKKRTWRKPVSDEAFDGAFWAISKYYKKKKREKKEKRKQGEWSLIESFVIRWNSVSHDKIQRHVRKAIMPWTSSWDGGGFRLYGWAIDKCCIRWTCENDNFREFLITTLSRKPLTFPAVLANTKMGK